MTVLIRDIWRHYRWQSVALVLFMVVAGFLEGLGISTLLPFLTSLGVGGAPESQRALDALYALFRMAHIPETPVAVALLVLCIFFAQFSFYLLQAWKGARLTCRYQINLRNRMFSSFVKAKWAFFVDTESAALNNAIMQDALRCTNSITLVFQVVTATLTCLIYVGISLFISWQLTLGMLLIGGLIGLLCKKMIGGGRAIGTEMTRVSRDIIGWCTEVFNGMKGVKSSASEEFVIDRFAVHNAETAHPIVWAAFQPHLLKSLVDVFALLVLMGSLVAGIVYLSMDLPMILVIMALFSRLYPRFSLIQQSLQGLEVNLPAVEQVERLIGKADRYSSDAGADFREGLEPGPIDVKVEKLAVHHGDSLTLRNVDMHIPAGKMVAIVGKSGSGKTTLLDSVMGLVEPSGGRIVVGGRDLSELSGNDWRKTVGYVGQEVMLFNGDIRDNILWDSKDVSDSLWQEAVEASQVESFVAEQSGGYATPVGDLGGKLSGGQRQRVAIARALLRNPPLLILDEATGALDSVTEQKVMEAIGALKSDTTILVVTHRLSTTKNCDHIYVLEDGVVVEHGTHQELRDKNGAYAALENAGTSSPGDKPGGTA